MKKGRYKLVLKPQAEINQEVKEKFVDLVNSGVTTLPGIEKILQGPPYNKSHGTIYNIMRECEQNKQIITWQEKGMTHLDIPPVVSKPVKATLISVFILLVLGLLLDVFIPAQWYTSLCVLLVGVYDTGSGLVFFHFFTAMMMFAAVAVTALGFFWWHSEHKKNRNHIKNGI